MRGWARAAGGKAAVTLRVALFVLYGVLLLPCLLPAFPFLFVLVFVLLEPPHRKSQPCSQCNRRAAFVGEEVREGEGRRSWTDLVIAEYRCPNGHTFTREWTASAWGD
jgi:hypothetical protein